MLHGKYRVPYQMSTDCENLIGKLLVLNPEHRACLEVRTSIFCTLLCILVTVYVLIQHIVLFVSKVVFSLFDHDVFSGLFMRLNGSTVSYVCFMLATSFLCTLRLLSRHVFILMNKLTLKNSKYLWLWLLLLLLLLLLTAQSHLFESFMTSVPKLLPFSRKFSLCI